MGRIIRTTGGFAAVTTYLGIPAAAGTGDESVAAGAAGASGLPEEYALAQNHPNPFDRKTVIPFQLPEPGRVSIRVYDISGREVGTLLDGELGAGYHRVAWEPGEVPDGVYVCRLDAGRFTGTRRMILAR